jgi:hypothetical protein
VEIMKGANKMGIPVPEGEVVKRSLQFFWLTDYSGSMSGTKIATLNQAIREAPRGKKGSRQPSRSPNYDASYKIF